MAWNPDSAKFPERVYLTMDCWKALELTASRPEDRDKIIEAAIWAAMPADVVDFVNQHKELVRQFKERQKANESDK